MCNLFTGLFQRAILQSGSANCPWAFTYSPKQSAIRMARQVNCYSDEDSLSTMDMVKCLREKPAAELAKLYGTFRVRNFIWTVQYAVQYYMIQVQNLEICCVFSKKNSCSISYFSLTWNTTKMILQQEILYMYKKILTNVGCLLFARTVNVYLFF